MNDGIFALISYNLFFSRSAQNLCKCERGPASLIPQAGKARYTWRAPGNGKVWIIIYAIRVSIFMTSPLGVAVSSLSLLGGCL